MSVTRSPLSWPANWTRTPSYNRRGSPFTARRQPITVAGACDRLQRELDRLGAKDPILSTNLLLRLDGFPRSDQPRPSDPGAAVYFTLKKAERCLACDRFTTVEGNIAALAHFIEAVRATERYGIGTLEQAFTGYTALPAAAELEWWLVLEVAREAPLETIEAVYRTRARQAHPDRGGSEHEMARLNVARDAATREKKGAAA